GSWGRIHSRDYTIKQKIPNTEYGVEKAIALGLGFDHPILKKAYRYLTGLIHSSRWRDPPEKNERWPVGIRLFIAATISLINPDCRDIDDIWKLWTNVVKYTFKSGCYSQDAEKRIHQKLTGVQGNLKYLVVNSKYHVTLLGSRSAFLSEELQKAYLNWIWNEIGCISYINVPLHLSMEQLSNEQLVKWLHSVELLSKFKSWKNYAKRGIDWLLHHRNKENLWDFGQVSNDLLRLSNNWRGSRRQHDWSTKILLLLKKFYE
ncbi:MAG: hypothetical protein GWN31_06900, partial [Candidatus Thorarchaeota archaeon]|nr:hypothetical protein [Candidatus Thorarchaeota archaeon]